MDQKEGQFRSHEDTSIPGNGIAAQTVGFRTTVAAAAVVVNRKMVKRICIKGENRAPTI